jgi:hypothetical protein
MFAIAPTSGRATRAAALIAAIAAAHLVQPAAAQPALTLSNDESGLNFLHTLNGNTRFSRLFGVGAAAGDYDNDGHIDLFLPQGYGFPNALYRNNGDATFTEAAVVAGVGALQEARVGIWLDYDNDGWLDLFVAHEADAPPSDPNGPNPNTVGNLLYHNNADGTFTETGAAAGVSSMPSAEPTQTLGGAAAGDINNDGYLDIYVSCWGNRNALFLNDGDGTFTEIGLPAGVLEPGTSWAPMFHDVDGDGWTDLLLNMDFAANRLYINQHDNTFVDQASVAGFATAFNEMGMSLGDYDNDGDLDVVATNIETPLGDPNHLDKYTVLLRNDSSVGAVAFSEQAVAAGLARTGWGWGCTWFDCDNDGWLDLAATNGFPQAPYATDPSRLFRNLGASGFSEISAPAGYLSNVQGRGLIALDYDEDGDADLLETNYADTARLFRNDTPGGNWLAIDLLTGGPGNRFAVGAVVTITAGGRTQAHLVSAGSSFLSAEPYRQLFGLGAEASADSISIRWPDGTTQSVGSVAANQHVRIRQGIGVIGAGDVDADGDIGADDFLSLVNCMTGPGGGMNLGCVGADLNHDNDVDLHDVAAQAIAAGP